MPSVSCWAQDNWQQQAESGDEAQSIGEEAVEATEVRGEAAEDRGDSQNISQLNSKLQAPASQNGLQV